MLFRSSLFSATWDTWMYYAQGKYYLYYLITENSPGEGFGVAVSEDGVHYVDHGMQLEASDKMVFYLGTGSVWKKRPWDGNYLCNYSEWRMHGEERRQQIFFAESKDLIHWKKLDEKITFQIDEAHYRVKENEAARWDCINTLPTGSGYYGYWTARPKEHPGVGFGFSEDGVAWKSLPPPELDVSAFPGHELESGSIMKAGEKYYMLIGCFDHEAGIGIMVSDSPTGPFTVQKKSPYVFANQEAVHGYFARFFETDEGTLVNFHVLLRECNEFGRPYTYMAPLKLVDIDAEGTLRLKWWQGNQKMLGAPCNKLENACIADVVLDKQGEIKLETADGSVYTFAVRQSPQEMALYQGEKCVAHVQRDLPEASELHVRILLRDTMMEWYVNEWYVFCYTFPALPTAICSSAKVELHRMDV